MRVLIVDDSAAMRERLFARLGELEKIQVVGQASNGHEALEMMRETRPDAVILDVRMPGKSGLEVLREIQKTPPAPVVLMFTNYALAQYRRRCLEDGAGFFFDKSKDLENLVEALAGLARERALSA